MTRSSLTASSLPKDSWALRSTVIVLTSMVSVCVRTVLSFRNPFSMFGSGESPSEARWPTAGMPRVAIRSASWSEAVRA